MGSYPTRASPAGPRTLPPEAYVRTTRAHESDCRQFAASAAAGGTGREGAAGTPASQTTPQCGPAWPASRPSLTVLFSSASARFRFPARATWTDSRLGGWQRVTWKSVRIPGVLKRPSPGQTTCFRRISARSLASAESLLSRVASGSVVLRRCSTYRHCIAQYPAGR